MPAHDSGSFDLDAYLFRIGYSGERSPTFETLAAVHLAHVTTIPFENLDIFLGRPIRLDLESLQQKLVGSRRGGYCFEHNSLLAAALEHLGFPVTRLAARVRLGAREVPPRTHMLLEVKAGGRDWLADVGFGGIGPILPLELSSPEVSRQFAWSYRLVEHPGFRILQSLQGEEWVDLYEFTPEPHYPVDFEVANHYIATHPDSKFVRTQTVQRNGRYRRLILKHREFQEIRANDVIVRDVDEPELPALLATAFGIDLPQGASLPMPRHDRERVPNQGI